MLGLNCNEQVSREMQNFPLSYSYVDKKHPAYHTPLHWHRPCEIVRVLSGNLKVYLDGNKSIVTQDDIIFINSGIIHGYTPIDCVYEIINFDANKILLSTSLCKDALRIFTNNHVNVLQFHLTKDDALQDTANHLFACASSDSTNKDLIVLGTLFELLGTIYDRHYYTENIKNSADSQLFKPLLEYIEKNYMKSITLSEMAQISGLSTSHFTVLFHDFFRQTPIDYLNAYRIECACLLLINSELSVTEISYQCGFNDSAYFVKVFKKYKNTTPKKYRTSLKGTDSQTE